MGVLFFLVALVVAGVVLYRRHKDKVAHDEAWPIWSYRMRDYDWFWRFLPPNFRERPWGWHVNTMSEHRPPPAIVGDNPEAHEMIGSWMIYVCRDFNDLMTASRFINTLMVAARIDEQYAGIARRLSAQLYVKAKSLSLAHPEQEALIARVVEKVGA